MTLVLVFIVGGICGAGLVAFGDGSDAMRNSFLIEDQENYIRELENYIQELESQLVSHGIEP